jgi:transcriptional regulator with XRE-family HTH domain
MTMGNERMKLSDQIRRAIDASGLSRYRICKEIGLTESTMSRFMSGQSGLSLRVLDDLADLLGLNITTAKRAKKRKEA